MNQDDYFKPSFLDPGRPLGAGTISGGLGGRVYECLQCGAIVADHERHIAWHERTPEPPSRTP